MYILKEIENEFYKKQDELDGKFVKMGDYPYFSEDYIKASIDLQKEIEQKYNVIIDKIMGQIFIKKVVE